MTKQQAYTLLEIMASITVFAVFFLSFQAASSTATWTLGKSLRTANSYELATRKLEELAMTDPSTLDNSDDLTETVTVDSANYSRVTDITVQADGSVTASVAVTPSNTKYGPGTTLVTTFQLWGNQ